VDRKQYSLFIFGALRVGQVEVIQNFATALLKARLLFGVVCIFVNSLSPLLKNRYIYIYIYIYIYVCTLVAEVAVSPLQRRARGGL
jgi:O-antigen ligase